MISFCVFTSLSRFSCLASASFSWSCSRAFYSVSTSFAFCVVYSFISTFFVAKI